MSASAGTSSWSATDFEPVIRGRLFEDFAPGQRLVHHWGRTLTDSDIVTFATATCAWNPIHVNAEFARAQGHPALVAPAALVLAIVVGLSVEDLSEIGGPFLGIRRCVFDRSVHAGETITAVSQVLSARASESRPGRGIVTWQTRGLVGEEPVVTFERTNLIAMRAGSQA